MTTPDLSTQHPPLSTGTSDIPALAQQLDLPYLPTLANKPISADFVEKIPIAFARHHAVVALAPEDLTADPDAPLPVAFSSLDNWPALDVLSRHLNKPLAPLLAPKEEILAAINAGYQQRTGQAQHLLDHLDRTTILTELQHLSPTDDLLDSTGRPPVVKLVNLLLFEAVQAKASDVHLQPSETAFTARMRLDGVLYDGLDIPKPLQEEVTSRIKVMAKMNIAEKRLPQDGRATVQLGDRNVDLRIATLPTSFGERTVIRLLDKSARRYHLDEIGMHPATLAHFRQLINADHGILLVTGPTGSGKTTTLYAALQELKSKELNILTLEDPIEYRLEGVSQTQVSEKKGMTFASGLRSVLRQDPDIIMVGEIRDHETATMAIQSALTGHLVFSTLHTNDAASAVTRLLDLGIEPYLIASSLIGVVAQRLVRKLCPHCATPSHDEDPLAPLNLPQTPVSERQAKTRILTPQGCPLCRHTGYSGRLGLFELLPLTEPLRQHITQKSPASTLKSTALQEGMHTLKQDGLSKILAHQTSVPEVVRVTLRATE